jgi:hypothetical protein
MEKDIRYVRSAIEDLAFTNCSLRKSKSDGKDVLSTAELKGERSGLTLVIEYRFGMFMRSDPNHFRGDACLTAI